MSLSDEREFIEKVEGVGRKIIGKGFYYPEEKVKECIKQLKKSYHEYTTYGELIKTLNKLAGDELTK